MGVLKGFRDRIILAGESADNHVMFGNRIDRNFRYVLITMSFASESCNVYVRSVLRFCGRLPLIAPNRLKNPFPGIFQTDAKTSDSSKEFDISNFFLSSHVFDVVDENPKVRSGLYFHEGKDQMKKRRNFLKYRFH